MMLWAVHIADGVLASATLAIGLFIMAGLLVIGCYRLREEEVAKTGVFTAILFIASLIHPPIPGAKVHLLLNGMAGMLLGTRVGLSVAIALTLQALLLSHGGLYAVGVNCATIGLPGLLVAAILSVIKRTVPLQKRVNRLLVGGLMGGIGVCGTLILYYLVLRFGAISGEDLQTLATIAFAWHVPVLIIEVIFSALLFDFLYRIKPELLGLQR
jgi:cobalt/nickel transport system permease protein